MSKTAIRKKHLLFLQDSRSEKIPFLLEFRSSKDLFLQNSKSSKDQFIQDCKPSKRQLIHDYIPSECTFLQNLKLQKLTFLQNHSFGTNFRLFRINPYRQPSEATASALPAWQPDRVDDNAAVAAVMSANVRQTRMKRSLQKPLDAVFKRSRSSHRDDSPAENSCAGKCLRKQKE